MHSSTSSPFAPAARITPARPRADSLQRWEEDVVATLQESDRTLARAHALMSTDSQSPQRPQDRRVASRETTPGSQPREVTVQACGKVGQDRINLYIDVPSVITKSDLMHRLQHYFEAEAAALPSTPRDFRILSVLIWNDGTSQWEMLPDTITLQSHAQLYCVQPSSEAAEDDGEDSLPEPRVPAKHSIVKASPWPSTVCTVPRLQSAGGPPQKSARRAAHPTPPPGAESDTESISTFMDESDIRLHAFAAIICQQRQYIQELEQHVPGIRRDNPVRKEVLDGSVVREAEEYIQGLKDSATSACIMPPTASQGQSERSRSDVTTRPGTEVVEEIDKGSPTPARPTQNPDLMQSTPRRPPPVHSSPSFPQPAPPAISKPIEFHTRIEIPASPPSTTKGGTASPRRSRNYQSVPLPPLFAISQQHPPRGSPPDACRTPPLPPSPIRSSIPAPPEECWCYIQALSTRPSAAPLYKRRVLRVEEDFITVSCTTDSNQRHVLERIPLSDLRHLSPYKEPTSQLMSLGVSFYLATHSVAWLGVALSVESLQGWITFASQLPHVSTAVVFRPLPVDLTPIASSPRNYRKVPVDPPCQPLACTPCAVGHPSHTHV